MIFSHRQYRPDRRTRTAVIEPTRGEYAPNQLQRESPSFQPIGWRGIFTLQRSHAIARKALWPQHQQYKQILCAARSDCVMIPPDRGRVKQAPICAG